MLMITFWYAWFMHGMWSLFSQGGVKSICFKLNSCQIIVLHKVPGSNRHFFKITAAISIFGSIVFVEIKRYFVISETA
jgi:hypothetical protein